MGIISDLESNNPARRARGRRQLFNLYRKVPDSTLVPRSNLKGLSYTAVAIKELRPPNRFYFEIDAKEVSGVSKAHKKAELLKRILRQLPQDFNEYEVEETRDGYHLVAAIPPNKWKYYFRRYKELFPESDFVDTGRNRVGLRISAKLGLRSGDLLSPPPKIVISTFKSSKRPLARKSSVYLTNP